MRWTGAREEEREKMRRGPGEGEPGLTAKRRAPVPAGARLV